MRRQSTVYHNPAHSVFPVKAIRKRLQCRGFPPFLVKVQQKLSTVHNIFRNIFFFKFSTVESVSLCTCFYNSFRILYGKVKNFKAKMYLKLLLEVYIKLCTRIQISW